MKLVVNFNPIICLNSNSIRKKGGFTENQHTYDKTKETDVNLLKKAGIMLLN